MATITLARDGGQIEIDMAFFNETILAQLAIHGLQQKVADACADKNKYPDAAAIVERSQDVIEMLKAGTWASKGGGARIRTLESYMDSEAAKAAKARMERDEKAKAAGLEKVTAAYRNNEAMKARWEAEWKAKQEAKATEVEI